MKSLLPKHRLPEEIAIDIAFADVLSQLPIKDINTNPASCLPEILELLAQLYEIDTTRMTLEQKREAVINAFNVKRYKGTLYALKTALKAFSEDTKVIISDEPYCFEIEVDRYFLEVDKHYIRDLIEVANKAKNLRSHIKGIRAKSINVQTDIYSTVGAVLTI